MKIRTLLRLIPCIFVLSPLCDEDTSRTWEAGDLRVTTPLQVRAGQSIPVRVEILAKPGQPEYLELRLNHLNAAGRFAGALPDSGTASEIFAEMGALDAELAVGDIPAGTRMLLLTIYMSPDRTWPGRSLDLTLPILPEGGDRTAYDAAAARVVLNKPVDAEAVLPDYTPRDEFFTQREEEPERREWRLHPPQFPPLADILALPAPDRSPAGIYCWVGEYIAAHAEIARMGIPNLRLAGPWDGADEAMRLAAGHGVEIFFTLHAGRTLDEYKRKIRPAYPDDEAFLRAFTENVSAFLRRYGPGGAFETETGLRSPLAAIGVWNEPNFQYLIPHTGDHPADEAAREALYPRLVRAARAVVDEIAPAVRVVAFSAGGADFGDKRFILNIHQANPDLPASYDAIAMHPYNKGAPPEAHKQRSWGEYSISDSRNYLLDLFRSSENPWKPVWWTELGWHFGMKHGGRFPTPANRMSDIVTPDLHAAYVIRAWLLAVRLRVERVHIMNLHDTDGFNGGFLVRKDFTWRPVAHAAKTFNTLFPRPRLLDAPHDGADGLFLWRVARDAGQENGASLWVLWNVSGPRDFSFPTDAAQVRVLDMVGNERLIEAQNGRVTLEAGPFPLYLQPLTP